MGWSSDGAALPVAPGTESRLVPQSCTRALNAVFRLDQLRVACDAGSCQCSLSGGDDEPGGQRHDDEYTCLRHTQSSGQPECGAAVASGGVTLGICADSAAPRAALAHGHRRNPQTPAPSWERKNTDDSGAAPGNSGCFLWPLCFHLERISGRDVAAHGVCFS